MPPCTGIGNGSSPDAAVKSPLPRPLAPRTICDKFRSPIPVSALLNMVPPK